MLKVKNFLMLGLLTVAVALFVPACTEDEEEEVLPTAYTVSIVDGEMTLWEDPENDPYGEDNEPLSDKDLLVYEDDVVIILSAKPEEGQVFVRWDVTPASAAGRFNDRTDPRTTFQMPAANVTITAVFEEVYIPVDGVAEVRFTWEAAAVDNITHISVNEEDVEWWYEDVFGDTTNVLEDFTDMPLYDGNPRVPSIAAPFDGDNINKGRYFPTDAGSFTAVCGAKDEYGYADIVANYTITINPATATADGKDLYFEIAFDVLTFLDEGTNDNAWFQEETEDPTQDPRLEKKKAPKFGVTRVATKQYKKPGATVDVTYYVIRRPKV
jgi:hypothetical protein